MRELKQVSKVCDSNSSSTESGEKPSVCVWMEASRHFCAATSLKDTSDTFRAAPAVKYGGLSHRQPPSAYSLLD